MPASQISVGATSPIGAATPRVDGTAKVTGEARYAAEFTPAGLVHAVLVQSTVPAGWITADEVYGANTARLLGIPWR